MHGIGYAWDRVCMGSLLYEDYVLLIQNNPFSCKQCNADECALTFDQGMLLICSLSCKM